MYLIQLFRYFCANFQRLQLYLPFILEEKYQQAKVKTGWPT